MARRLLVQLWGEGVSESTNRYLELREVEAAGQVRDLERALAEWKDEERHRTELWREAAHDLRGGMSILSNASFALDQPGIARGRSGRGHHSAQQGRAIDAVHARGRTQSRPAPGRSGTASAHHRRRRSN